MDSATRLARSFPKRRQRQKVVQWALRMTKDTTLAPDAFERLLLARYVRGFLTLDQVLDRLARRP